MRLVAAILLLCAVPVTAGVGPVSVTMSLPAEAVLPGVPFDITVSVANVGTTSVAVPRIAEMTMTPFGGSPTTFKRVGRFEVPTYSSNDQGIELAPGEKITGYIPWSSNWSWDDAALTVPGTYDIFIKLYGKPEYMSEGVTYAGIITTNSVRLVRKEPTGTDALVWHRLKEASHGEWPSHGFGSRAATEDIAAEVLAKYPDSGYCPYAAVLPTRILSSNVYRDLAARFPQSPAYPRLLLQEARAVRYEGRVGAKKPDEVQDAIAQLRTALSVAHAAKATGSVEVQDLAEIVRSVLVAELQQLGAPSE